LYYDLIRAYLGLLTSMAQKYFLSQYCAWKCLVWMGPKEGIFFFNKDIEKIIFRSFLSSFEGGGHLIITMHFFLYSSNMAHDFLFPKELNQCLKRLILHVTLCQTRPPWSVTHYLNGSYAILFWAVSSTSSKEYLVPENLQDTDNHKQTLQTLPKI